MACYKDEVLRYPTISPPEVQKIFENWRTQLEKPVADALKELHLAGNVIYPQTLQATTSSMNNSNLN